jgi:hypothetical protein
MSRSKTLQLGRTASVTSVHQAMCSDEAQVFGTNPITESAGKLASAYYGWTFTIPLFLNQGCPLPGDQQVGTSRGIPGTT